MATKSKWSYLDDKIIELYREDETLGYSKAARELLGDDADSKDIDLLRTYIKRLVCRNEIDNTSESETKDYSEEVDIDALKQYCKEHNIDYSQVKSAKYINHMGQRQFNIVLHTSESEDFNWNEAWDYAREDIKNSVKKTWNPLESRGDGVGVLKLSDLHIGAYIEGLKRTGEYSVSVLSEKLLDVVKITNSHNYDELYVHIHGDIIESFSGLNHINSWHSMAKGQFGANVVKLAVEILHQFLFSKLNNLVDIKLVGGNHDRTSKNNDEDVKSQAADLISWGLGLLGYDVEFDPLVISHDVDGINYIILHGDKGLSKRPTEQIIWDYGIKGMFNYVAEGHLHTRIQKTAGKKEVKTLDNDSIDFTRRVLPSLFTGNFYSESLGYYSNTGFVIIENNGKGRPNTFDYSI
jgi:hypothetical protein